MFSSFLSWSIAFGSGTSGGTLAPLLTISRATGVLLGTAAASFFPKLAFSLPLAALLGMSAMFAGASRALLTSIVFAIETTEQSKPFLPLLAACLASYPVSYLLMKNTIMTEKIAHRGVATPHIYQPDILNNIMVKEVLQNEAVVLSSNATLSEVRTWLTSQKDQQHFYVVADEEGVFKGIISSSSLFSDHQHEAAKSRI